MFDAVRSFKYVCDLCGTVKYKESEPTKIPDKWEHGANDGSYFCDFCSRTLREIEYNSINHMFDKTSSIKKRKHGYWINRGSWLGTCSVCNFTCERYDDDIMDEYCPHCGARMVGCICK